MSKQEQELEDNIMQAEEDAAAIAVDRIRGEEAEQELRLFDERQKLAKPQPGEWR